MNASTRRFPVSFDGWYAVLSTSLGLPPASAYVVVGDTEIHVRMGWAFRSTFSRTAVASTYMPERRPLSRGVHGFGGRWLVNGSGHGVLGIRLSPPPRAHVLGVPIRLRELLVSVEDREGLAGAIRPARSTD